MIDKEIEAGIKRACECDCAPPSTGWTVNPFPIIRDYIERIKHRAEVAEREAVILAKWLANKTRKDYPWKAWFNAAQKQAEREIEEEKGK